MIHDPFFCVFEVIHDLLAVEFMLEESPDADSVVLAFKISLVISYKILGHIDHIYVITYIQMSFIVPRTYSERCYNNGR